MNLWTYRFSGVCVCACACVHLPSSVYLVGTSRKRTIFLVFYFHISTIKLFLKVVNYHMDPAVTQSIPGLYATVGKAFCNFPPRSFLLSSMSCSFNSVHNTGHHSERCSCLSLLICKVGSCSLFLLTFLYSLSLATLVTNILQY